MIRKAVLLLITCVLLPASLLSLPQMLLLGVGGNASGPLVVNVYSDMDAGNDGDAMTTTITGDSTVSTATVTWTVPGTVDAYFVEDNPCNGATPVPTELVRPISVSGTVYTEAETGKVWQRDLTVPQATAKVIVGTVTTNASVVLDSFDICVYVFENSGSNYNYNSSATNGMGFFSVTQINDPSGAGPTVLRAHCDDGPGTSISISDSTWYHVRQYTNTVTAECIVRVYLRSTMAELTGSPSTGIVGTGANVGLLNYDTANSTGPAGKVIAMKNRVTCWTGACATATTANFINLVP